MRKISHAPVVALAVLLLLLLSACGKKDSPYVSAPDQPLVPIDPGPGRVTKPKDGAPADPDAPAPETPTNFCARDASGNFPDGVGTTNGETRDFVFGRGGGCIHRPIRDVWGAALNQNLMVWNGVSESSYQRLSPPANVTHFFRVHSIVHDWVTVDWDVEWYHSVPAGSPEHPDRVLINYKKVSGTRHISYWEGTIVLDRVTDEITSFAMANQIDAARTDANDAQATVRDVYGKLQSGAPDLGQLP